MPSIETLMVVTLAGLALSASPGPSMLYVLSRAVGQSHAAGFASAIGLALGGALLAVMAAFGLTTIFHASPTAYQITKIVGACYLVYLGIEMIVTSGADTPNPGVDAATVKTEHFKRIIAQGVFVELFNPKTILFFLSFVPQFVDPERGSITTQMLVLGMLVPLTAIPSDIVVSVSGGSLAMHLKRNRNIKRFLEWLGGLFLIGIGLHIFLG